MRVVRLLALLALLVTIPAVGSPRASAQASFHHGFVLTGWTRDAYLEPSSDAALQRMRTGGSDHAAIFTQWFLSDPTASALAPDPARTPSDAALMHAMHRARQQGMEVTLKPQIGIRSGGWVGSAQPADENAFWTGFRAMLLHYADLADRGGASTLVIGTEMRTMSSDEARWRPLIAELRTHFHGALTYAANYDEFLSVPFWDALDYIGIDAYFPLADDAQPSPPAAELAAAWSARGYLGAIAGLSARTGKKVLFTELGYRAAHSTAGHPSAWAKADSTDTQAQSNAYQAFYDAVARQPWMAGVYWWDVNADRWWVQDYSPIGKPAEQVLAISNLRLMLWRALPFLEP
ncbi:MAG: hypothetical protein QOE38_2196 [Thermoleophilaceae bacterium]|nr:hypothetical protein [Thermoleophilaceae bacterium]